MVKQIKKLNKAVLSTYLLFSSIGCHSDVLDIYQPKRVYPIPSSAVWYGGIDGGNWFDCKPQKNHYFCKIYLDNGYLTNYGDFRLYNEKKGTCEESIDKEIIKVEGYDTFSEIIFLDTSFSLRADGVMTYPFIDAPSKYTSYICGKEISNF
ncbi:hypothetical protein [Thiolinea disciformis]|uniref:hypothetical protein n=1 Tax=Thiolinea disciformis TaxID=125614 RepID=UPI0003709412|nr:hypothetical protein [Thiolinea disciformis]